MAEYEIKSQELSKYTKVSFEDFTNSLSAKEIMFITFIISNLGKFTSYAINIDTIGEEFYKFINKLYNTRIKFYDDKVSVIEHYIITGMTTNYLTKDITIKFSDAFINYWKDYAHSFDIVKTVMELESHDN